jgi:hypothetical protein
MIRRGTWFKFFHGKAAEKLQQQENDDDFFNAFASSSPRALRNGIFSFCFVLLVFSVEWQMLPPE